jgi:type I restriction enzyme M protein
VRFRESEAFCLSAGLQGESQRAKHPGIQDRGNLRRDQNKITSGYNPREIIDHIDELRFRSQTEKHELSHLYEAKIKNMGNAGRNGGEYYTPRPLIRAMVKVVQPKIGERIYDGACGSAGFLCEALDFLRGQWLEQGTHNPQLTTKDLQILQTRTFYGKEKKSLAYVIAIIKLPPAPATFLDSRKWKRLPSRSFGLSSRRNRKTRAIA